MTTYFFIFMHNLAFLFQTIFIIGSELFYFRFHKSSAQYADNLLKRLAATNILNVKVFQAIALNNSWISEETNQLLLKYTDQAPWDYTDVDYASLDEICRENDLELINYGMPINSGMISVVYKAIKGKEGKTVAIKMKRKNIDKKLEESIHNLNFLLYCLTFVPILQMYAIPQSIQENIASLKEQTSFIKEVDNMLLVQQNFKRLPYIVIPQVYKEITLKHNNVIVTDFVDGNQVIKVAKEDREEYAQLLNKFVFISLFVHGVSHGDLHGGNILFLKDGDKKKIGLLDFGVLYKLSNEFRETLFEFCLGIFSEDLEKFAKQTLDSAFFSPRGVMKTLKEEDRKYILSLIQNFVVEVREKKTDANQMNIYNFFFDLNLFAKEHQLETYGIRLSDDFIKLQMFIAMSQGVSHELAGEKYVELANEALTNLFKKTLSQFAS